MRKLIVSMNCSLDGFMAGPHGELDWHFHYWNQEMSDALCTQMEGSDAILLGRVTYQAMASFWPSRINDRRPIARITPTTTGPSLDNHSFARLMNDHLKLVFSNTITSADWNNSRVLSGHLTSEVARLKTSPGKDIIIYGSRKLVTALIRSHLVDEYRLWVHPLILGQGRTLFPRQRRPQNLQLITNQTLQSGVIALYYHIDPPHRSEDPAGKSIILKSTNPQQINYQ